MYLNIKKILRNSILHKIARNMSIRIFLNLVIFVTIIDSVHSCGPGRGIGGPRKNRKLTPLVFKQHVPNMSENTMGASGLHEGKIRRDHPKFKDLVPNYNKDIIFKDEEGTGADRLMTQWWIFAICSYLQIQAHHVQHCWRLSCYVLTMEKGKINYKMAAVCVNSIPLYGYTLSIFQPMPEDDTHGYQRQECLAIKRCKEKLNTLAVSVMNQWPGVRLRVTESWDEDNLHGPDSLHYEGRAVDITTSDRDRSKYGMLARLAVEAGFDWVYYESRAHIHCSVKSDSSQSSHISGCFTAESTVLTANGVRQISEVQIGEKVLSMTLDGDLVYSEVIMFLDRDTEQTREFVQIETDGGATLTVTPAHLVMVWSPAKKLKRFVFAAKVQKGDFVLVNRNNTLEPRKVVHLSTRLSKGLFAPLTKEGTIVVDSVVASCYALVNSQAVAHWSFVPVRVLNSIWHWMDNNSLMSRQSGVHWYANLLYSLKDMLPADWIYH